MADLTKVYYFANGVHHKTVFAANEAANYDHTLHDDPACTGIILPQAIYKNTAPAVVMNGVAWPMSLNAAVAAYIAVSNPVLSALILSSNANADVITAALSAVAIGP